VYRGVAMGAPERRIDPKFHIPLISSSIKSAMPVPPKMAGRGHLRLLQDLIAKGEILFGEDETVQPQRKVVLHENSRKQMASVIQDTGRGKLT